MFACLMLHHRAQPGVYRGRHKEPHKCLFKAFWGSSRVVKPPRVGDLVIIFSTLHFYYFHIFHFALKEKTRKELKFCCKRNSLSRSFYVSSKKTTANSLCLNSYYLYRLFLHIIISKMINSIYHNSYSDAIECCV